jgi:hypothetical protein
MRIGRAIIIPAILALGVGGSILAGSAAPVAAVHAPSVHVQADAAPTGPYTFYHS